MNKPRVLTVDEAIELLSVFSLDGYGQHPLWFTYVDNQGALIQSGWVALDEHYGSLEVVCEDDYRADLMYNQYELLTLKGRLSDLDIEVTNA